MGVHGLWSILKPVRKHRELCSLSGQTLAVDLSIWVVESLSVLQMQGHVTKPHLRNLFFRVSHLLHLGVQPVFVIDGEAPELKWEVMAMRQQTQVPGKRGSRHAKPPKPTKQTRSHFKIVLKEELAGKCERYYKMFSLFSLPLRSKCCEMLDYLGVPYVHSQGEAEAFCALLNIKGLVDGCITDDGDVFLYGAMTVYRNFTMNTKDPHVDSYTAADIERDIGLSRSDLVALAILLGCDYLPNGVPGVGKKNVNKLIKTSRNQDLLKRLSEWKEMPRSKLYPAEVAIHKKALALLDFPNSKVIAEFLTVKDTCPRKPLTCNRPKLSHCQRYLFQKMEWPDEYSEQKVLPLVTLFDMNDIYIRGAPDAQRHLMPHRIVKRRVRQFVPCFEVEWYKGHTNSSANSTTDFYTTIEEERIFSRAFSDIATEFQQNEAIRQAGKKKKVPSVSSQQIINTQETSASQTAEDYSTSVGQAASDVRDLSNAIHLLDLSSQTSLQNNRCNELRAKVHCTKSHSEMESLSDSFVLLNLEHIPTCGTGPHAVLSENCYAGQDSQKLSCSKNMYPLPSPSSSVFLHGKTHTHSPNINRVGAIKCNTDGASSSNSSSSDDEEHTIPLFERIGLLRQVQEKVATVPSRMLSSQIAIPITDEAVNKVENDEEINMICMSVCHVCKRLPYPATEIHDHPDADDIPNILMNHRAAVKDTVTAVTAHSDSANRDDIIDISDDWVNDIPVEHNEYEDVTNVEVKYSTADKNDIISGSVPNEARDRALTEFIPGSGITASFLDACSESYTNASERKMNDVSSFAEELTLHSPSSSQGKINLSSVDVLPSDKNSCALNDIRTKHCEVDAPSCVHGKTGGEYEMTFNEHENTGIIAGLNISQECTVECRELVSENKSLDVEEIVSIRSPGNQEHVQTITPCESTKQLSQHGAGNDNITGDLCFVNDECSPINCVLSFNDKLCTGYQNESPVVQPSSLNDGTPRDNNATRTCTPLLATSNASEVNHSNNSNMNSLDLFTDSMGGDFSCNDIPEFTIKTPRHIPIHRKTSYHSYIATPEVVQSQKCTAKYKYIQSPSSFSHHPANIQSSCSSEICLKGMSLESCKKQMENAQKLHAKRESDNLIGVSSSVRSPPFSVAAITGCSTSTPCGQEFSGSSINTSCRTIIDTSPITDVMTAHIIECFNGNLTDNVFHNSELSINAKHKTQEHCRNLTTPVSKNNTCSTSTSIEPWSISIIQNEPTNIKELLQNESDYQFKNIKSRCIDSPLSSSTDVINRLHVEPYTHCMTSTPVSEHNYQCVAEPNNNKIASQKQSYTHLDQAHTSDDHVSSCKVTSQLEVQILKNCEDTGRMNSKMCKEISDNHTFKQSLLSEHDTITLEGKQKVSRPQSTADGHHRQNTEIENVNQSSVANICSKECVSRVKTDTLSGKSENNVSGQCERRRVHTLPVSCNAPLMESNINVSNVPCSEATASMRNLPLNSKLHVLKNKENIKDSSPLALADRLRLRLGGIPVMKS